MINGIGKTNACLKISTVSLCLLVFSFKPAFAQTDLQVSPPQATCITPQGAVIADYSSGTHGVPGNTNNYSGSDKVYNLGNSNALQCFCTTDGSGVDTIWWGSISSLTQSQIDNFVSQGWIYIPNGALWGLEAKPYLAKNSNYLCSNTGSGGQTISTNAPEVLGSSLAATGGKGIITTFVYASILWLLAGLLLKFKSSKNSRD